jgi:F-type H+-transporting ATPase subunit epsilon
VALTVELVAADRKVWDGAAARVSARTADGEIGILPGHAPLLGVLVQGEVRIAGEGSDVVATVDGGFLSVDHDRVTIVVESAEVGSAQAR